MSDLVFLAEETASVPGDERPVWKVLVVDDEPDVHRVTALIAADFEVRGRRIQLLSAHSAQSAREILQVHGDIALALVDVVMEHHRAGLDLVNHIRNDLRNVLMRIVLRTGQPGDAPEQLIVREYDISDYREKASLGSNQLLTVLRTNLATYDAMRQLHDARRSLQELNDDLVSFNQMVAHDLRSPLKNIHAFADLLRRRHGSGLEADALQMLAHIEREASDMGALVSDLLHLSRIGREERHLEPVDLNAVVAAARGNLHALTLECNATVECEQLPTVLGVRVYLMLLFQNLIENALKYNRSDRPRVKIAARAEDQACVFEVADNGIGIDAQDAPFIFRPFRRGANADRHGGAGVGLATCQRVVDFHGGQISVESAAGQGSVFRIRLPASKVIEREREAGI